MGGIMARAGGDNDELVDALIEEEYIRTPITEKVFRAVDRANYFLPEARSNAYNGLAWKSFKLHLSAPCVYSAAMEGLCIKPGLSFLNLGSGTGYFSTMVGLILGSNGINHGIEFYSEVVDYANIKLDDFRRYSGALDEFDFCEPKFKQGNALCLSSDFHAQYDRVYCGAAVPEQYESYMKNLLRIGGILVMPVDDKLLRVTRTSTTQWESESLLPVSFATLIPPNETDLLPMFHVEPPSIQALCRTLIRNILRKNIELENPKLKQSQKVLTVKKKRTVRKLIVPLFDSDDSSEEDAQLQLTLGRRTDASRGRNSMFNLVLGTLREDNFPQENNNAEESVNEDNNKRVNKEEPAEQVEKMDMLESQQVETQAVIEHNPNSGHSSHSNESLGNKDRNDKNGENSKENTFHDVFVDVFKVLKRSEGDNAEVNKEQEEESDERQQSSTESNGRENKKQNLPKPTKQLIENYSDSSDDEQKDISSCIQESASSSDDDDHKEKRNKRGPKKNNKPTKAPKWRKLDLPESNSDNDEDDQMKMYESAYTELMMKKIQDLPLPPILKNYLNFYRGF